MSCSWQVTVQHCQAARYGKACFTCACAKQMCHSPERASGHACKGDSLCICGGAELSPLDCLVQVARTPGANLLQVTWEHMTLLPAAKLQDLRDCLLRFLGQSAQCTTPVQEVEELYGAATEHPVGSPELSASLCHA